MKSAGYAVKFIVDTGSPTSFIDEHVTERFRIYAKNFKLKEQVILAGNKIGLISVKENITTGKHATIIPVSILGMDFLYKTKAKLVVKPSEKNAFIEF